MKEKNSSGIWSKRSKWLPVVMACTIIVGGSTDSNCSSRSNGKDRYH